MTKDEWGIHLFAENADQQMAKVAMEMLAALDPKTLDMKKKVKEIESSIWYSGVNGKNYGDVAAIHRDEYCSTCDSRTLETKDCWGKCPYCGKYNYKKEFCRFREENQRDNKEGASKAENKKKPKEKKKAKKGIEQKDSRRESKEENSEDSDFSEEDSTKKRPMHQGRAARA